VHAADVCKELISHSISSHTKVTIGRTSHSTASKLPTGARRCTHSSIAARIERIERIQNFSEKIFLPSKNSLVEDGTKGLRTGSGQKNESIRINLSDLGPEQVRVRDTGNFHPCIPDTIPGNRSVFGSKKEREVVKRRKVCEWEG
jgi:hypothetical protein